MNRPFHENDQNRLDELAIADECAAAWGLVRRKIPGFSYGPDFVFTKHTPISFPAIEFFVEVKKRNLEFGYEDGLYLSVQKVRACWGLKQVSGRRTRLAIRFKDGKIRWVFDTNLHDDRCIWAGRKDRVEINGNTEEGDMEPCFVFDWAIFQEL